MCGSYGWSIIIITVIVRLLFWPITQKANNSMKRMQKVQPQMKEIREKYKKDPQTMNAKVMELYRKEKVNPLGGCLPILLQIPVFIALYSTLNGAVELRQVPFWWINDLAKPDTVAVVLGLPINPLVIVMTSLMVLQQRLTPSAMDPTQQKMMMFMPIMMLFILYNLPAGLTLYWTVSQILAILQLYLQKHMNSGDEKSVTKAKKAV
jgi:YidC/Oxa1 family membrane protein insertase